MHEVGTAIPTASDKIVNVRITKLMMEDTHETHERSFLHIIISMCKNAYLKLFYFSTHS